MVVVVAGLMAAEAGASLVGGGSYGGGGYRGGGGYYGGGGYRGGAYGGARSYGGGVEVGSSVEEEIATQEGLKRAAIPVRPEIGRRRIFVPQSTMASGIRSATPVVPPVPRV